MRWRGGVVLAALIAGCSSVPQRLGSDLPPGAKLSDGRLIEGRACDLQFPLLLPLATSSRYQEAYAELERQARGDLIVDVAIEESARLFWCTRMTARAVRVLAPPPAVATPAPAFGADQAARLRDGAALRIRPQPEADPVGGVDAAASLTLKSPLRTASGTWWFVTSPAGSGWVLESDLAPATP